MRTTFYFKHFTDKEKEFLQTYVEDKLPKFSKLLQRIPDEEELLEVKAERFATKNAYKVEFILRTPRKQFISEEDDHTLAEAVDACTDKLMRQLRDAQQ